MPNRCLSIPRVDDSQCQPTNQGRVPTSKNSRVAKQRQPSKHNSCSRMQRLTSATRSTSTHSRRRLRQPLPAPSSQRGVRGPTATFPSRISPSKRRRMRALHHRVASSPGFQTVALRTKLRQNTPKRSQLNCPAPSSQCSRLPVAIPD